MLEEGFHEVPRTKIEVLSSPGSMRLCPGDDHLIALVRVGNDDGRNAVPCFAPDYIETLADFIENEILVRRSQRARYQA